MACVVPGLLQVSRPPGVGMDGLVAIPFLPQEAETRSLIPHLEVRMGGIPP